MTNIVRSEAVTLNGEQVSAELKVKFDDATTYTGGKTDPAARF